jgi:hypothetical protein
MVICEGTHRMKMMILQGRWLAATSGAWVAAWALMASPATAQQPESSAEKPRASDGWKQKTRQGSATDDGAKPEAEAAATKNAPAAPTPKADTAKSDAVKGAKAPPASKPDPATKPANAAKSATPPERRAVPTGSGERTLAAEKAAIDAVTAKTSIDEILARTLPPRSDRAGDWLAGSEPLHQCGEPRWIEPCIPLPPCHPSHPPHPYDLVGVVGDPTCGPIYRGPCSPRTGTHDDGPHPRLHRVNDRFFDAFYKTK